MSVQRQSVPPADDLETTAELPVLDVAAYESAPSEERTGSTDTWHAPGPNFPAHAASAPPASEDRSKQLEADLRALSESLRDVEERLTRKGQRLIEIEHELAQAHAERIAVDERAATLISEAQARSEAAIRDAEARSANAIREAEERSAAATREAQERAASLVTAAEQRSAQAAAELSATRTLLTAEQATVSTLRSSLEEHEHATRELRSRDRDLTSTLASREREISIVRNDLRTLETRATGYLETLQTLEGVRNVFEEQFLSLDAQLGARDQQIVQLRQELTTYSSRTTTLDTDLVSRQQRIAELETAAAAQAQEIAARDAKVAEAQDRIAALEQDLQAVRAESAERAVTLRKVEGERDGEIKRVAAAEARANELEQRLEDGAELIRQLQEELRSALNRGTELEGDLNAAEDAIHRLEGELRTRSAKVEELTKTHEEWRTTIEDARQSLAERDSLIHRLETEARNSATLLGNIQQSIRRFDAPPPGGGHEIAPEGAVRLLIRVDGDSEVVHVLGRKTTVGRTPDNDLQIDAKFISRNHAVILAGPNHTIIEDLNSTNGVAVNGRRISRHTLRDGDTVAIGKTTFRFAVRASQERERRTS